jgi:hypothetical protein
MIRPNLVGCNVHYEEPAETSLTTADIAAIDSTRNSHDFYPYAYTATIDDNYDEQSYLIGAQTLPTLQKLTFGLFLSPDLEKQGLIFNVNGHIAGDFGDSLIHAFFVFGRTASDVVTSSKVAQSNLLEDYVILPASAIGKTSVNQSYSIDRQVYARYVSDGSNYFFGICVQSHSGSDKTVSLQASLQFAKFGANLDCFRPDRT